MSIILALILFGFVIRLSYKITGLIYLWWRKEYRLDRMLVHLGTKQGETVLFGRTHLLFIILIALWFWEPTRQLAILLLSLFVLLLGISYLRHFRHWLLPPASLKVMALLFAITCLIIVVVAFSPLPMLISLTIADLFVFPVSVGIVTVLTLPTLVYHKIIISRAVRMLRVHKPMMVIGVTGSFGKTSVKEYLSAILSSSYDTLKTEASKNSPIAIAETVIRSFTPSHEVFVVEMGAYKRGEIKEMAAMVHPQIGIVTAINAQHQDLFGSIETTMKAKYELLQGLHGRKIAIINLDSSRVRELGMWAYRDGSTIWGFTTTESVSQKMWAYCKKIFSASNIRTDLNGVSFDCALGSQKIHVRAPLIGAHQVGNILAAIAGSVACGMSFTAAARGASRTRPAEKVMEVKRGVNGVIYIDDTFNNNPDAAIAALEFLGTQKGKKILVFQPMIELGTFADSSHEEVGMEAAKYCDAIFLTNANHFGSFERGVRKVSQDVQLVIANPMQIAAYIRATARAGDVVLFKGKDTEHALRLVHP